MSKVLKNTTGADIIVNSLGLTLPASSSTTIEVSDYILLATPDVVTELTSNINSGDIVINDGTSDLSASEGLAYIAYPDQATNIRFTPTTEISEDTVQEAIGAGVATALNTPRYTIILTHNGTLSNNEFIGYTETIPGDATPIIIPINSVLEEYTFSNNRSTADYGIELRKNSTTGTVFNSVSKDNTQTFVESSINESFNQGDQIYIKYLDQGANARDVAILLVFRATS